MVGLVYPNRDRYSTNHNTVQHTTSPAGCQTQASVVVLVQNHWLKPDVGSIYFLMAVGAWLF